MRSASLVVSAGIGVLALLAAPHVRAQGATEGDDFRITLLGTGSPTPSMKRFGPAILVQAGKETLLIDCGRGATQRLFQIGVRLGSVDALFLTHLHSDHTVGIPDLWLMGWLEASYAQRRGPFRVFGPAGTRSLMENLERAYEWDIRTRIADQDLKRENVVVQATDFTEGAVYERNGVKVTALEVNHGPLIKPAFGFRVDYDGRSAVFSGDTKFNENLIRHASGADLLIHEVGAARAELLKNPVFQVIIAHHTTPEEAGVVFSRVKPKLAVYSHFVLSSTPQIPPVTEKELVEMTRKTYSGPLLIGEDLMSFRIGHSAVTLKQ
jgi:ribonuclease Z